MVEATFQGNFKRAKLLLDHNADVNRKSATGITPLWASIIFIQPEMTELFLSHGATITHEDIKRAHEMALDGKNKKSKEIVDILARYPKNIAGSATFPWAKLTYLP